MDSNNLSHVCGVFTSWFLKKGTNNSSTVTLHFAINRFVDKDLVHYDLPANNKQRSNKDRAVLYIELETVSDPGQPENLASFNFVDDRFNNLIIKDCEYVLAVYPSTKEMSFYPRNKGDKIVNCYCFNMNESNIATISPEGTFLWTKDKSNLIKMETIEETVKVLREHLIRVPVHRAARNQVVNL